MTKEERVEIVKQFTEQNDWFKYRVDILFQEHPMLSKLTTKEFIIDDTINEVARNQYVFDSFNNRQEWMKYKYINSTMYHNTISKVLYRTEDMETLPLTKDMLIPAWLDDEYFITLYKLFINVKIDNSLLSEYILINNKDNIDKYYKLYKDILYNIYK